MLDTVTSESIQRWVRVFLYSGWGYLGAWGATPGAQNIKAMVAAALGFGATALWTKYGSTVKAMLTEIEKTSGVEKVDVKVDPTKISPIELNQATPEGVTVKPVS